MHKNGDRTGGSCLFILHKFEPRKRILSNYNAKSFLVQVVVVVFLFCPKPHGMFCFGYALHGLPSTSFSLRRAVWRVCNGPLWRASTRLRRITDDIKSKNILYSFCLSKLLHRGPRRLSSFTQRLLAAIWAMSGRLRGYYGLLNPLLIHEYVSDSFSRERTVSNSLNSFYIIT